MTAPSADARFVLDTNALSELFTARPDPGVIEFVTENEDSLAITSVTVAEVTYGLGMLPEGRRKTRLTGAFWAFTEALAPTAVLELDEASARRAGLFQAQRRSTGQPLALADALIAGIVAEHGLTLVTRNTKDFVALGLDLLNPWRPAPGG